MHDAPIAAFLEIFTNRHDWTLPRRVYRAIKDHLHSSPTALYLPWPSNLIVQPGRCIDLPATHFHEGVIIKDLDYSYSKEKGITVYMEASVSPKTWMFNLIDLLSLADQGFMFESRYLIADALKEEGLPLRVEDYPKEERKFRGICVRKSPATS
jgi:hypothetical protein